MLHLYTYERRHGPKIGRCALKLCEQTYKHAKSFIKTYLGKHNLIIKALFLVLLVCNKLISVSADLQQ